MAVYFVQAGDTGPVKIGFARDAASRLVKMQADNPAPLAIRLLLEGDEALEAAFHAQFAAHKLRGEWFKPEVLLEPISDEIKRLPAPLHIDGCVHALRTWMAAHNVTAADVAKYLRVDASFVGEWLDGTGKPNPRYRKKIAEMVAHENPRAVLHRDWIEAADRLIALLEQKQSAVTP